MIVQCEACQTRFRLADEKVKPGGTKVRCSKCKEIFTVSLPEPEPVEEAVDFGSFNMEAVAEDSSDDKETTEEAASTPRAESSPGPEPEEPSENKSEDVDFSAAETGMGREAGSHNELADDFTFVDTDQSAEAHSQEDIESSVTLEGSATAAGFEETQTESEASFAETAAPDESAGMEFDFNEAPEIAVDEPEAFSSDMPAENTGEAPGFSHEEKKEEAEDNADFSFEGEQGLSEQEDDGEFSFDGEDDSNTFDFEDTEESPISEPDSPDEFSFDDETPFSEETASEWGDESPEESPSFDFEEPQFNDEEESAPVSATSSGDEGGLQFGEIDFASDDGNVDTFDSTGDDFANATMETQPEPESLTPQEQAPRPPSRDYSDEEPLRPPPRPKKSSLSRILVLLVLLLLIVAGAAGFLFMQEGTLNLNMVTEYAPFLKEYIGGTQEVSPTDSIDINISGSSYVNNAQAGQMLVIQGSAVNQHTASRSSITIKGVLVDAKGKTLLQQTVFCGNAMTNKELEAKPFKQIEEAMNNEFGEGLSNMNVSGGSSIPFTIVFRNLPDGIANINVEVVDSKPGAN
jgi:predicted Zn finger-like uncharacterized protein